MATKKPAKTAKKTVPVSKKTQDLAARFVDEPGRDNLVPKK